MTCSTPPKSLAASARGDRVQLDQAGRQPQRLGDGQVARFVEADVAVAADAEELDVQAAVGLDPAVELGGVRGRRTPRGPCRRARGRGSARCRRG